MASKYSVDFMSLDQSKTAQGGKLTVTELVKSFFGMYAEYMHCPGKKDAGNRIPNDFRGPHTSLSDEDFSHRNIKRGDCIEMMHRDGENTHASNLWILRVTEVKKAKGFRGVWFFTPQQTFLAGSGVRLSSYSRFKVLYASTHCECNSHWHSFKSVIRKVKVHWGRWTEEQSHIADFFCDALYDEDDLRFLDVPPAFENPNATPEDLCGCVQNPQSEADTPTGFIGNADCVEYLAEKKVRTRDFHPGTFVTVRRMWDPQFRQEDVCEVDDFTVDDRTGQPLLRLRQFLRPDRSCARANELTWTDQLEVYTTWEKIRTCVQEEEVFVEYVREGTVLPKHLTYNGAGRYTKFHSYPMKYGALALMCGTGSLVFGLVDSGFCEIVEAVDCDTDAIKTFNKRAVHRGLAREGEDLAIREGLNPFLEGCKQYAKGGTRYDWGKDSFDVIVGGLACGPWSQCNRYPSEEDRSLVISMASYAEFFRPKIFILENVAEFARFRAWSEARDPNEEIPAQELETPFNSLCAFFLALGYRLQQGVLHAAHHARGTPTPKFPMPTHYAETPAYCYDSYQYGGLDDDGDPIKVAAFRECDYAPCMRLSVWETIGHLPSPKPYDMVNRKYPYHNLPKNNAEVQARRRLQKDGLFATITSSLQSEHNGSITVHPVENRLITVHEAALAQGFPVEEISLISGSLASVKKQIANAVPMPLAFAVGCEITKALIEADLAKILGATLKRAEVDKEGLLGEEREGEKGRVKREKDRKEIDEVIQQKSRDGLREGILGREEAISGRPETNMRRGSGRFQNTYQNQELEVIDLLSDNDDANSPSIPSLSTRLLVKRPNPFVASSSSLPFPKIPRNARTPTNFSIPSIKTRNPQFLLSSRKATNLTVMDSEDDESRVFPKSIPPSQEATPSYSKKAEVVVDLDSDGNVEKGGRSFLDYAARPISPVKNRGMPRADAFLVDRATEDDEELSGSILAFSRGFEQGGEGERSEQEEGIGVGFVLWNELVNL
ncbi:hypothetical protein HDU67_000920 [Dinochytrium kinnereticum]|nr:hypothetical protein HDU67_000920 [Dinochytrium kinnereticum]